MVKNLCARYVKQKKGVVYEGFRIIGIVQTRGKYIVNNLLYQKVYNNMVENVKQCVNDPDGM